MFDTLAAQIGAAFVVLVCAFAFVKGDEPERLAAGTYVLGWFACLVVQGDGDLYQTRFGLFAIDLIILAVFGAMVWKANRSWPVWACAMQLLIVMSHVLMLVDLRPPAASFITVINLSGYGVLISLAIGTFWAWQERRAAGLE